MLFINVELNLTMQRNGTTIQIEFGMTNNPAKIGQSTFSNRTSSVHSCVAISVKRIVLAQVIVLTTIPQMTDITLHFLC